MAITTAGALAFGGVLGYVTHYLVRRDPSPGAHDLAGIVASLASGLVLDAVGGPDHTGAYFLGLALGFILYWLALRAGQAGCSDTGQGAGRPPRARLLPLGKRPRRRR